MEKKTTGKLLRVYIGANDRFKNEPLFEAIVLGLKKAGLAGATVIRGIEGFGATSKIAYCQIAPPFRRPAHCNRSSGYR